MISSKIDVTFSYNTFYIYRRKKMNVFLFLVFLFLVCSAVEWKSQDSWSCLSMVPCLDFLTSVFKNSDSNRKCIYQVNQLCSCCMAVECHLGWLGTTWLTGLLKRGLNRYSGQDFVFDKMRSKGTKIPQLWQFVLLGQVNKLFYVGRGVSPHESEGSFM